MASANQDTVACDAGGLDAMMSTMTMADAATLSAASNVKVVLVSDCAADEVSSALATEGATNVRKALEANAAVVAAIQSRGVTMAEVLGATSDGTVVTVYAVAETSGG